MIPVVLFLWIVLQIVTAVAVGKFFKNSRHHNPK